MSKYDALREYLDGRSEDALTLTLAQIDAIVKLPAPARRYAFWWSNDDPDTTVHVQSKAWQSAGYEAHPNLRGKRVEFRRKTEPA